MMIAPGQIAPRDLPALPLASRAGLPECAAIYFVIADDGEILYVGRATTLRSRWTAHHRREEIEALGGGRIAWLEVSDAAVLPAMEDACVAYFAPRLNGTRVPEKTFLRWATRMLLSFYAIPKENITIRRSPFGPWRVIHVLVHGTERMVSNEKHLHEVVREREAPVRDQEERP